MNPGERCYEVVSAAGPPLELWARSADEAAGRAARALHVRGHLAVRLASDHEAAWLYLAGPAGVLRLEQVNPCA
jgi:hypothetical protein